MKPKPRGFTLVELLVTIAIIAVLAALSIVFLTKGMESARAVRCVHNVKQLLNAQLMIADDTGGYLVHGSLTPIDGKVQDFAMHFTALQFSDLEYSSPDEAILKHITEVDMLSCPTAYKLRKSEMSRSSGPGRWRTYALNDRLGLVPDPDDGGSGEITPDGANRQEQVQAPHLLMMVSERSWTGQGYPNTFGAESTAEHPMPDFHKGGFHVGYMDGHVAQITYTKFPYQGNTLPDGRTVILKPNPETPDETHWSLIWRGTARARNVPSSTE